MKTVWSLVLVFILLFGCAQQAAQKNATDNTTASLNITASLNTTASLCPSGQNWCDAQQSCIAQNCLRLVTESFPPYNFLANGTISGQSTEVVKEIMLRLNQTATMELMNWSDAYGLALAGPATGIYSTARTPQRESLFKWVGPIGSWDNVFYGRSGSAIAVRSLEDAKKAGSICVVKDDAREQLLVDNGFSNLHTASNDMVCAGRVVANETDLWLGSSTSFNDTVIDGGYEPSEFQALFTVTKSELYIAFSNDTSDSTVQAWQKALDSMKADGTFNSIAMKYSEADPSGEPSRYVPCFMEQSDWKLDMAVRLVEEELSGAAALLNGSAQTADAKSGNWSRIKPLLLSHAGKYPAAVHWYALTNGTYYTLTDDLASGNLANRSYFPVALGGNTSIGSVIVSKSSGKNSVVVAVPVASNGTVSGVLGASLFLDNLSMDTSMALRTPKEVRFFAIDSQGQTVLSQATEKILSADSLPVDAKQQALAGQNGTLYYAYEGETWEANFEKSLLTGWTFVLSYAPSDYGQCGS